MLAARVTQAITPVAAADLAAAGLSKARGLGRISPPIWMMKYRSKTRTYLDVSVLRPGVCHNWRSAVDSLWMKLALPGVLLVFRVGEC